MSVYVMWKLNSLKHKFHFFFFVFGNSSSYILGSPEENRLDGPGSNSGGGEISCNRPDRPWSPPGLL